MSKDVWLVLGSTPEESNQTLEAFTTQEEADFYLMRGLLGAFGQHVGALEPGGTLSLIVNRGEEAKDGAHPLSSGSFVINNVGGDRHVWDFHTLPCEARPHE